ncbi:stage II sporulation protein M [Paenibacillus bouchesdurhonensis]|uniref:stage II sporulation protein M n=1 Tax=Paenibacillus bouchesdurhonensis TaxID=1870990 RepID=UPI000DA63015|nr:stage II sporulation protein M [Paenibacillus bouchesdurhonensis]
MSFRRFIQDLIQYRVMIFVALGLFIAGIIMGVVLTDELSALIAPQIEALQEVSGKLSNSSSPELSFFIFIFLNNAVKSLFIMGLGALFGFMPIVFLVMNGMVLGFLVHAASAQGANMFDLIVKGLLPHGIIEIPAIVVAAAYGLQFGYLVMKSLGELGARDRHERSVKWGMFFRTAGTAAIWITVALLVAAMIESTITFHLVKT